MNDKQLIQSAVSIQDAQLKRAEMLRKAQAATLRKAQAAMLRNEIKHLTAQIEDLSAQKLTKRKQIAELFAQFQVGDVIQHANWPEDRYRVMAVLPSFNDSESPHYTVHKLKKDGTLGARQITGRVYSYESYIKVLNT